METEANILVENFGSLIGQLVYTNINKAKSQPVKMNYQETDHDTKKKSNEINMSKSSSGHSEDWYFN